MAKKKEATKKKLKLKKFKTKQKKEKKKGHLGSILLMMFVTIGIMVAVVVIAFGLYIVFTAPEFSSDNLYFKEASIIEWSDGTEMTRLGSENRVIMNYEDYPQVLIDALVATEDSRFFQHTGFDLARFLKASIGQLFGKSGAGGASTLTMQLSKNYFTSTEASGIEGIIRKFTDIYIAVFKIEKNYTKEQIIEMYLNTGFFANDGSSNYSSIEGVEQASQYFFDKSVTDLTLPEAAMIIGMYNAPTAYNPYNFPEECNDRKNTVLSLMYRHGYISEQEMLDAQSIHVSDLVVEQTSSSSTFEYQALVDYVYLEVYEKYGINLYTESYRVRTTFDKDVQDIVNDIQNGEVANAYKDDTAQSGISVVSVSDGSITALGAGRNYVAGGVNRAASYGTITSSGTVSRIYYRNQIGSTAKPLVDYGPLIEYNNASTKQMFIDFKYGYNDGTYMNNWDMSYYGVMTLKDALSQSRNVPALEALHQLDPDNIVEFLGNLGIDEDNYGSYGILESMSIGAFDPGLTPLEVAAAYATFARGGYYIEPYSFTTLTNMETEEVIEYKYEKVKAMSEETAYMITDILLQATSENVAGAINSNLKASTASKSGTTNITSSEASALGVPSSTTPDNWVVAYNTEYCYSIWTGYDSIDSTHYLTSSTGGTARRAMSVYLANNILTNTTQFTKPDTVVSVTIESQTLPTKLASEYTPDSMKTTSLFKSGTEPSETSTRFAKLSDASNAKTSVSNKTITISWSAAETPSALDLDAVKSELSSYFSSYKTNYSWSYSLFENQYMSIYESYNNTYIGSFGYQVYLKDANGNLTSLGWTDGTSFTYTATTSGTYTFVIKSSYSIFKSNQSTGITVTATVSSTDTSDSSTSSTSTLKATATKGCVEINGTINPKELVTVTLDGKDVTSSSTVVASSVDTSTTGEKDITYTITYNSETIKISGKVTVSETCGE